MAKSTKKTKTAKKEKIKTKTEVPIARQRAQRTSKRNRFYFNDNFDTSHERHEENEVLKTVPKAPDVPSDVVPGDVGKVPEMLTPIPKLCTKKSVQKREKASQKFNKANDEQGGAKSVPKPSAKKLISIEKLEAVSCNKKTTQAVDRKSNKPSDDNHNVGSSVPKPFAKKLISIKKHEVSSNKKITGANDGGKPNSSEKQKSAVLPECNKRQPGDRSKKDHQKKFIRLRYELDFSEGNNVNVDDYVKYLMNNMKVDGRKNNLEI